MHAERLRVVRNESLSWSGPWALAMQIISSLANASKIVYLRSTCSLWLSTKLVTLYLINSYESFTLL